MKKELDIKLSGRKSRTRYNKSEYGETNQYNVRSSNRTHIRNIRNGNIILASPTNFVDVINIENDYYRTTLVEAISNLKGIKISFE